MAGLYVAATLQASVPFHGRRNTSRGCRVTYVAPRSVNGVSYVTKINHGSHFVRQAQYLVTLEGLRNVNDASYATRIKS